MPKSVESEVPTEATLPLAVDLRALLAQRVEQKLRRVHKAWFCLDPQVQADFDAATEKLAELAGIEIVKQQGQPQKSGKYALPNRIGLAEAVRNELLAKSRQVGAMAVFQNLRDDQIEALKKVDGSFPKAKMLLTEAFLRWETADGQPIPADQFGADDLDALLQPEVLEQGEWLPLASKILEQSTSAPDRPTSPRS